MKSTAGRGIVDRPSFQQGFYGDFDCKSGRVPLQIWLGTDTLLPKRLNFILRPQRLLQPLPYFLRVSNLVLPSCSLLGPAVRALGSAHFTKLTKVIPADGLMIF